MSLPLPSWKIQLFIKPLSLEGLKFPVISTGMANVQGRYGGSALLFCSEAIGPKEIKGAIYAYLKYEGTI